MSLMASQILKVFDLSKIKIFEYLEKQNIITWQNVRAFSSVKLHFIDMERGFCWMWTLTDKSRNIFIIKGRSMNTTPFSVPEPKNSTDFSSSISSIHSRQIKFLDRIIDHSISDKNSPDEQEAKLITGLDVIGNSLLMRFRNCGFCNIFSPKNSKSFACLWGSNLSCYQTRTKDFLIHQEMVTPL